MSKMHSINVQKVIWKPTGDSYTSWYCKNHTNYNAFRLFTCCNHPNRLAVFSVHQSMLPFMWSILYCCRGMWLKRRKLCSSCFKVSRRELMLLERRVKMNEDEGFFTKKTVYCWSWGSLFSTVDVSYLLLVGMSPFICLPTLLAVVRLDVGGCLCLLPVLFFPCVSIYLPGICVAFLGRLFALLFVLQVLWPFGLCLLLVPLASSLMSWYTGFWSSSSFFWTALVLLSRLGVGTHRPLTRVFRVSLSPFLGLGEWDRLCVCGLYKLFP